MDLWVTTPTMPQATLSCLSALPSARRCSEISTFSRFGSYGCAAAFGAPFPPPERRHSRAEAAWLRVPCLLVLGCANPAYASLA